MQSECAWIEGPDWTDRAERLSAFPKHGKNAMKSSANSKVSKPAREHLSRAAGQELQQIGTQGSPDRNKKEAKLEQQLKDAKEQLKVASQRGKGDKGKGEGTKGKDDKPGPKIDPNTGRPPVCFQVQKDGVCNRQNCPHSHHPQDTGRTKTGDLTKAAKRAEEEAASAAAKGKGKGKGKGKKGAGDKDKSKILCKFTKKYEKCPKHPSIGIDCPYNHRKREFDEKG